MVSFSYLTRGLAALAHAHRAGAMAGHLGAAVVAGYFFGEDLPTLPASVYDAIESELDRVIAGEEAIWWDVRRSGITAQDLFQSLPEGEPDVERITSIATSLDENVPRTRQSGHNVIFASIALRILGDHPALATAATIEGLCQLVRRFNGATAGRGYFGKEKGWLDAGQVELPDEVVPHAHDSLEVLVGTTIDELIATASVRKQGFGGLWHLINHAAGIVELNRMGYHHLAQRALPAHHEHLRLWRSLPDVEAELGPVIPALHDPIDPVYWQDRLRRDEARLTHRIKTLYGFYTLMHVVDDPARRERAQAAFRYLMA